MYNSAIYPKVSIEKYDKINVVFSTSTNGLHKGI